MKNKCSPNEWCYCTPKCPEPGLGRGLGRVTQYQEYTDSERYLIGGKWEYDDPKPI